MNLSAILLLAIPAVCHGFLTRDQSDWNGLKVTWGINPLHSFQDVPRTQHDADRHGWVNMAPGVACDGNHHFRGVRYWKDGDLSTVLIYDAHGYIAGIQAGIPKNYSPNENNYPYTEMKNKPFILEGNNYFITAYFVDPATICAGRTASLFHTQGTGTGLWIQNGTNPVSSAMKIPDTQDAADKSMWTKGACFVSMGVHYWYNLRKDMPCEEFYPVFLLYNEGVLNGFGWAFQINLNYSNRLEHPPHSSYGNFMTVVPDCLPQRGTMTTFHIYLTNSALADIC